MPSGQLGQKDKYDVVSPGAIKFLSISDSTLYGQSTLPNPSADMVPPSMYPSPTCAKMSDHTSVLPSLMTCSRSLTSVRTEDQEHRENRALSDKQNQDASFNIGSRIH